MTIGRNDPCPCGSGKKYKKCCGLRAADGYEAKPGAGKEIQARQNKSLLTSPWYQSRWEGHRQHVDKLLAAGSKRQNALLLGPGNCNDFDLAKLVRRFAHVDLLDIDPAAVIAAVKELPPADLPKVSVIEFDVTGLYQQLIPDLMREIPAMSAAGLAARLDRLRAQLTPVALPWEIAHKEYDTVAVLAVFSQLFIPFYEDNIVPLYPEADMALKKSAFALANRLSELCFASLLPLLHAGTQFTFYSDLLQFSSVSPALAEKLSQVNTALGPDFYRYRIVGADGFINYVDQHFNSMARFGSMDTWIWEFDRQRNFYTMGITLSYQPPEPEK